ncbi:hypothetical protein PAMP_009547 [Pampus punctatissimus]
MKTPVQVSRRRPEEEPRTSRVSRSDRIFKNRNKPKRTEVERIYSSMNPPNEDCGAGKIKPVINGRFSIHSQLETKVPNMEYQLEPDVPAVQAQEGQMRIGGQRLSSSEESWQKLQPVVECGDDSMTLTVRRRRAVQLLLDRVNESSVPLSLLPPECGYSVQSTWRDLRLTAQYNACHVTQEDDSYVLPLLWRGTPVKMSCPVSHVQPQAVGPSSLCCSPYSMTVKVQGLSATEELKVKVRGEWTSLIMLAQQCGYTLDRQDAEILIAAPLITCGITVKDGKYILSLKVGEKAFTLACPVSPPEHPITHQPLVSSPHHLTSGPTEPIPETLESFPRAPPFYLAPPYYPHPTYHHRYPGPGVHNAYNPPTPTSSSPDPTFGPWPIDSDYQVYYSRQTPVRNFDVHSSLSSKEEINDSSGVYSDLHGLSEKRSATAPGFLTQVEAPSLQPPSHVFNPYYHYYHHPKIPLPGPPEDPDPGPEVPAELSLTNSNNPEFPVLLPNVQQSEALSRVNSDQSLHSASEAASAPYILSTRPKFYLTSPAPRAFYPPQPYPYHYLYYFPYITRGQAKKMVPLYPNSATKTNLSHQQHNEYLLPQSSAVPVLDKYDFKPYTEQSSSDAMINLQKYSSHRLLSEDDVLKAEVDDKKGHLAPVTPAVQLPLDPYGPEQPSPLTPSSSYKPPPYPYNYHPYGYNQMYYRPESLLGIDNSASVTSSKEAFSTPQHPYYCKHHPSQPTNTPPTDSMYDNQNGPVHPYYYYYQLYYQPKASIDNQDSGKSMNSEKENAKLESQLSSDSDFGRMDWQAHAAETGYRSIPQPLHSPLHIPYFHYITRQHPHDPSEHPGGEEAEDRQNDKRRDHLTYTNSASLCGLNCSVSLGCCSYPVKDCTVGEHFVFAVPDSVVEPTVVPPAHPSEASNVSCTLQRLTSDPDLYTVPLDGCGVSKHVFGHTVVHLLEIQGIHSVQQDHSSVHVNSPIRLMVECSSTPGSPGWVRFHVMDQSPSPPPVQSTPATVTVQLRIATDESFSTYHPEAHLPLSLVRGIPVYVEVSLLDPPEPNLVLLVHSCMAYTQAPYASWMLVYDGCPSRGDSQLLPSPPSHPHHIRRIMISSFLSLSLDMAKGEYTHLEDPEIYFLCLTEVCSAADGDCTVGCINVHCGVVRSDCLLAFLELFQKDTGADQGSNLSYRHRVEGK